MKIRKIIFTTVLSALVCFGLLPGAQAVEPAAPDTALAGGNTADGQGALFSLTTGFYNSAFGLDSVLSITDASFDTGIGAGALLLDIAGSNTAVGAGALLTNSTGSDNNAFGTFALFNSTTGFFNNAVGHEALFSNVDGSQNNALGDLALFSNTSGGTNTAVGDDALFSVTTGNSNTALGDEAGSNLGDGEGNIYIGAQVQAAGTGEFEFIRIGNDTAFTFPYDTYIAGIFNRSVDAGTAQFVFADTNGKIGTVLVDANGNVPEGRAFGRDPRQIARHLRPVAACDEKETDRFR